MNDKPRHDTTPPSGSARAGLEAPRNPQGRRMLLTALGFVILLFVVFLLIPGETEEAVDAPAIEATE